MTEFWLKDTEQEDLVELSFKLRQPDLRELRASYGESVSPLEALIDSWNKSTECFVCGLLDDEVPGEPEVVFGLHVEPLSPTGIIWAVGSDEIFKHPVTFTKAAIEVLNGWFNDYNLVFLNNTVYVENTGHIKWLKFLGAAFGDPEQHPRGTFLPFSIMRHNLRCVPLEQHSVSH